MDSPTQNMQITKYKHRVEFLPEMKESVEF